MKTFIYVIKKKTKRSLGGFTVNANVYRVKNNEPKLVATAKWQTAATKGDESEIMNALVEAGQLPKSYYGYYTDAPSTFVIFRV